MDRVLLGHVGEQLQAKYYRLTPAGRNQLTVQNARWEQVARAIGRILKPATD